MFQINFDRISIMADSSMKKMNDLKEQKESFVLVD